MSKIKKILFNSKVIMLLVFILLAIVAINPQFDTTGVTIRSVEKDSAAFVAGIQTPKAEISPTKKEAILSINSKIIEDLEDYVAFEKTFKPGQTLSIETTKGSYVVTVPLAEANSSIVSTDIGLRVYDRPTNNLKKGLDISGGTQVYLKPASTENLSLTAEDFDLIKQNIEQRLNVYGLTDLSVRVINDKPAIVGGKPTYIAVEIAGADDSQIKSLLESQGKFVAKIANKTVFEGGQKDITYICRSAECSGLDFNRPCGQLEDGYVCSTRFSISLSNDAAKRFANITKDLDIITSQGGNRQLSENIEFFLDDEMTDSLSIDGSLKGQASTDVMISGSGSGTTELQAREDALNNMKQMQSVLSTGSMPVKLEVVNTNLVSPTLGESFLKNVLLIGIVGILSVGIVILVRYRVFAVVLPIMFAMISEVVLLLGMASTISWTLDLAAIAGIIVAVGTGVDDNIIITDEILKDKNTKKKVESFAAKLKKAFFIVFGAYATTVLAMIPLGVIGAGMLKGFAITTIAGVSIGVFIARPAFASVVEILVSEDSEKEE